MNLQTTIVKRDGTKEPIDIEKLHKVVEFACNNLAGVSASEVELKSHIQFYNNMTTKDIQETLTHQYHSSQELDLDMLKIKLDPLLKYNF